MRARTALLGIVLLAAGCGGGGGGGSTTTTARTTPEPSGITVTFQADTHTPKIQTKWFYDVIAAGSGTITVTILDPFGGKHTVQYDGTKKNVTNYPFTGQFHDYLEFPPESEGFKLTIQAVVHTENGNGVARFSVTTHK